jgi:hypothetical protein
VDASLEALERVVRSRRRRGTWSRLPRWTEHANDADRAESWRRLLVETDTRRILFRLWGWRRQTPPAMHPRLFELACHSDRFVRRNAATVLGQFEDARIRELALRLLRENPVRAIDGGVLELLERNALDEDAARVGAALPRRASREVRMDWARGVHSLTEARRSPAWTPLLVRALEATPCRHCRSCALQRLVDRGAAEDAVLREALFDADEDTRRIARQAIAARRVRRPVRSRSARA